MEIQSIKNTAFRQYGRIIKEYDFSDIIDFMEKHTEVPKEGNTYLASVKDMESLDSASVLSKILFGDSTCQIGYCNGVNSSLNGLEYHKSSEINIAATDFVLLLGKVQDIEENRFDAKNVEAFYVPKGTAIEIYATTLHFAPCKVVETGFKCVVVLPKDTNTPLEAINTKAKGEERLLFMKNKWLIAHPERKPLIEKGAFGGIKGENITIEIK